MLSFPLMFSLLQQVDFHPEGNRPVTWKISTLKGSFPLWQKVSTLLEDFLVSKFITFVIFYDWRLSLVEPLQQINALSFILLYYSCFFSLFLQWPVGRTSLLVLLPQGWNFFSFLRNDGIDEECVRMCPGMNIPSMTKALWWNCHHFKNEFWMLYMSSLLVWRR